MDFFQIREEDPRGKKDVTKVSPDFTIGRSKDLMVRGQSFYAIWDEKAGFWSTDEYDVVRLVDEEVVAHATALDASGTPCKVKLLSSSNSQTWYAFRKFMKNIADNSTQLDAKVAFSNTPIKKSDHVSKRLDYALVPGSYAAYDELIGTLYLPEERAKLEWAIGSILAGDSKKIQKFIALYGPPGSGKGTALDILKSLLPGYYTTFKAKDLVGNTNNFATEAFKDNPLIGIDPDAKMDRIEDNTTFNMIVGHDELRLNEKFKPSYTTKINTMLFVGTNSPVKITDAKSGIIRRLIDVRPSGNLVDVERYGVLMAQIEFELGAIAHHCLEVYRSMGKNYYNNYRPTSMILETDVFYNFIEWNYDVFKAQDSTTLTQAYALWNTFCEESQLKYPKPRHLFREELKSYFREFKDRVVINGTTHRSVYNGFIAQPFKAAAADNSKAFSLVLDEKVSLLDTLYADQPAQYAKSDETPAKYWTDEERLINGKLQMPKLSQIVDTVLSDLDTSKLHFVKLPENHIVIDFDLEDEDGNKSLLLNLRAASEWPATYAEISKSGGGVHLHYMYGGDARDLASLYSEGIEIKTFGGNASLRRRVSQANNVPVATISSGLPYKEKKSVLQPTAIKSERGLRDLVKRNLRKEIHPGTKPSIDFIAHILDDANREGMVFDLTDMRSQVIAFANNSTNQSLACLKTVLDIKFQSDVSQEQTASEVEPKEERLVFFDVEVYPNLFVICWKYEGVDTVVRMINPKASDVESLFVYKLVGFNNREYDNHILWAAMMGYNNQQLFELSQKIIAGERGAKFGKAYAISYADIYDFTSTKKGLKWYEIQLHIHHMEMNLPWDQPVEAKDWTKVVEYCVNDVNATEAVFNSRKQDFVARQIMASLSGLDVNSTTRTHATKILFGNERDPQDHFNYTDLTGMFPGYVYDPYAKEKSTYRDKAVGEGGYVYAEPGMYENVTLLDIKSMHPTSIVQLDLFGKYTARYADLKAARLSIKAKNMEAAITLVPELAAFTCKTEQDFEDLADALKLFLNSVYGYTYATFPNAFRDPRNVDNIVAKMGALFMVDLLYAVQERGFQVVHIKTDSIKIPNATEEIIDFIMQFGQQYGYDFALEKVYDKFCLVNDAVYIARDLKGEWHATGAEFKHPVVFKALFSHEPISFDDLCETKEVRQPSTMYLDFNESVASPANPYEGMHFVGRTGMFVPVHTEIGGAKLLRVKDGKTYAVPGTKGYVWLEADMVKLLGIDAVERMRYEDLTWAVEGTGSIIDIIDMQYYSDMVHDAAATIDKFGSFEEFVGTAS